MMQDTNSLINEYGQPGADKLHILRLLAARPEPKALAILLDVAVRQDESDTARIEALSGIKLFKGVESAQSLTVGRALVAILEKEEDDLIRGYAATSLRSYIAIPGCLDALEAVVRNTDEDIDLRYNAFDAIESNIENPECRLVYANLQSVPEFQDHVLRRMSEE